ncbi:MAG: hypothetical protein V4695_04700 [Pseudomonadota bacterium]
MSSTIKVARNPGDLVDAPAGFFKTLFVGTARADGLQVQHSHRMVLKEYAAFIDVKTRCVNPTIKFVHTLKNAGKPVGGSYQRAKFNSTEPGADIISFNTYELYMPTLAAHEYLHCYTHQNFINAVYGNASSLSPASQRKVIEGSTTYLTRKTPVSRAGDPFFVINRSYGNYVKFIKKVVHDIGEDTLKKAYLSGDPKSIERFFRAVHRYDI